MSVLHELQTLHSEINEILNSTLSWATKYDLIFSDMYSKRIFALTHMDYYDPDTTYEADVRAFVDALNQYMRDSP